MRRTLACCVLLLLALSLSVAAQTVSPSSGQPRHLVLATYDPLSGKVATAQADLPD